MKSGEFGKFLMDVYMQFWKLYLDSRANWSGQKDVDNDVG
jgi:hypothetical protein